MGVVCKKFGARGVQISHRSMWLGWTRLAATLALVNAGCGDASSSPPASAGGSAPVGGSSGGVVASGGTSSGGVMMAPGGATDGGATSGGSGNEQGGSPEQGGSGGLPEQGGSGGSPEQGGSGSAARGGTAGSGGSVGCNAELGSAGTNESEGGSGGADEGSTCGEPGDVIAAGMTSESLQTIPMPELEPLRGCKHFRGTLQLVAPQDPAAVEALASLEEIDGSLLLSAPPAQLGALSRLRRVGDKLIAYDVYETLSGLEGLESVGALWVYQGSFANFDWLPKLARIERSFIARRNMNITPEALSAFAAERVVCGADVSLTDSVPAPVPSADADAVLCGEPNVWIRNTDPSLKGCTRLLGSIHLPDIGTPEQLRDLSSLIQIDGSLTLFRNGTPDFTALKNLRRVGGLFQPHLLRGPTILGFEKLEEVGELNITHPWDEYADYSWLPALKKVRESAFVERGETPAEAAVMDLISRLEVGGEILRRAP